MNTSPRALLYTAREIGCEFYLLDGRWKMRGPKNAPVGLLALVDFFSEDICRELSRGKSSDEIMASQAAAMLDRRPPIWKPKIETRR